MAMFTAICDQCGDKARVPFDPKSAEREGPIYCRNCWLIFKPDP